MVNQYALGVWMAGGNSAMESNVLCATEYVEKRDAQVYVAQNTIEPSIIELFTLQEG